MFRKSIFLFVMTAMLGYGGTNANASVMRYNAAFKDRGEWGWSPFLIPGTDGSMRTGALAYLRF